jgi:hypothetical protein
MTVHVGDLEISLVDSGFQSHAAMTPALATGDS